jgi:hypothetical protein
MIKVGQNLWYQFLIELGSSKTIGKVTNTLAYFSQVQIKQITLQHKTTYLTVDPVDENIKHTLTSLSLLNTIRQGNKHFSLLLTSV